MEEVPQFPFTQMLCLRNTQRKIPVNIPRLRKDINRIREVMRIKDWDVGVLCMADRGIQRYNLEFRNKNAPTDIISIPVVEDAKPGKKLVSPFPGEKDLGDIYLGMGHINARCIKQKKKLEDYLPILIIHGLCHLIGYDHEKDEDYKKMQRKERYVLKKFLASRPA